MTVGVGRVIDLPARKALDRLAVKGEYLVRAVEFGFFMGLDVPPTDCVRGVSESTVQRDWVMARAWHRSEMDG